MLSFIAPHLVVTLLLASSSTTDPARMAVLATERSIATAQVSNDVAEVERLLAPGYLFTLPNGTVVPKAEFLANMRAWWRPTLVENTGQAVSFPDRGVAIVSGEARYRWRNNEQVEEEARERYTDTYVIRGDGWRRVASHSSCLAGRCT